MTVLLDELLARLCPGCSDPLDDGDHSDCTDDDDVVA